MNRQCFLSFYILIFSSCALIAQYENNNQILIEQYLSNSKTLLQTDIDSSLAFVQLAIDLSKEIDNDTLLIQAHLQKSSVLIFKKRFPEADSILRFNLGMQIPHHLEGKTLHNLGTIQYYKQNFDAALSYYIKAASILEYSKDSSQLVKTYTNIGTINASIDNYDIAQSYLEKALPLSDINGLSRLQILVNLCTVYQKQKFLEKFKLNIFEAEALALKLNSLNTLSVIYTNLTTYYTEEVHNYDQALLYAKKAIRLKKDLNQLSSLDVSYNNIGYSYLKKKEYRKAITYLDSALISSQGVLRSYVYNNLKGAYIGLNEYQTAMHYSDLKDEIKDSLANALQKEKVVELTQKFESEKKQRQIEILDTKNTLQALTIKQQNYILTSLIGFTFLALIIGFFGFNNFKTRQQLNHLLLQQKLKKTQLNPHFLFNALQSIQNFIYQNDKEKSNAYLTSYSKLIRLILEKSDDNFLSVEEDKLALESYLLLQQLNYNGEFSYSINIDNSVTEDFEMLPTLITQPFVENAVLHGIREKEDGHISVNYYKQNEILYVSIKDNGKGFKPTNQSSTSLHKSMSMDVIKDQLTYLNKSSKQFEGNVTIDSSHEGTEVVLSFNNA